MRLVKRGDTIRIDYVDISANGAPIEISDSRLPEQFTVGAGQIIPGLDEAVVGLQVGERKTIAVTPDQAYGPRDPTAFQAVPRIQLPPGPEPEIGQQISIKTPDGQSIKLRVADIGDDTVFLDGNHPLAGQDLTFEIEIIKIS